MAFKTPPEIAEAGSENGVLRASTSLDKTFVAAILAGAYIAFGGLLAVIVTAGLDKTIWGNLPTLITGGVFTVGLMLVVVAGADLVTGNMATVGIAVLQGKVNPGKYGIHLIVVLIGNLLGALFVGYFLTIKTGLLDPQPVLARLSAIATMKGETETESQIFLRAIGCNWLVCIAVWMAIGAQDIGGKILAIFFPIMAFVAMGFDHVVANMFFLPTAMFAHVPGLSWGDVANNLTFALLGNLVGASVFVAGAYWYMFGRGERATSAASVTAAGPGRHSSAEPAGSTA
jgi:formate/nitrite transporter